MHRDGLKVVALGAALLLAAGCGSSSAPAPQAAEPTSKVLVVVEERLMAPRPHPWGLIVMMIELIKNPAVNVWERESTKAAPQIQQMLAGLVHGQDPSGRLGRGSVGGMM